MRHEQRFSGEIVLYFKKTNFMCRMSKSLGNLVGHLRDPQKES